MEWFSGIIELEELRKALHRGPRPGHKYISRRWDGNKWVYKYRKTKADAHGMEHVGLDYPHTVDMHPDSEEYAHPPEQAYKLTSWLHQVAYFVETGREKRQYIDANGRKRFQNISVLKDNSGKNRFKVHSAKFSKKFRFILTDLNSGKQHRFSDGEILLRWVHRNSHEPTPVSDIHGELHHTLHPVQRKVGKTPKKQSWMRAVFNTENPKNAVSPSERHFRSKEEYQRWWNNQIDLQILCRQH